MFGWASAESTRFERRHLDLAHRGAARSRGARCGRPSRPRGRRSRPGARRGSARRGRSAPLERLVGGERAALDHRRLGEPRRCARCGRRASGWWRRRPAPPSPPSSPSMSSPPAADRVGGAGVGARRHRRDVGGHQDEEARPRPPGRRSGRRRPPPASRCRGSRARSRASTSRSPPGCRELDHHRPGARLVGLGQRLDEEVGEHRMDDRIGLEEDHLAGRRGGRRRGHGSGRRRGRRLGQRRRRSRGDRQRRRGGRNRSRAAA